MKTPVLVFLGVSLSSVFSGCGDSHAESHEHADVPAAATYKEGHGIKLSEPGAAFVGLELQDVESRDVGPARNTIAIPADALLRTIKGDFVYVANGEWFLRTAVETGAVANGWIEITAGLYEGDQIVVRGVQPLWLAEVHAVNGGVGCAHGH